MVAKSGKHEWERLAHRWALVGAFLLVVLAAGCDGGGEPAPSATPTVSPVPTATATIPAPTPSSTPAPTPTPASPSPFSALPLEPLEHAEVMVPGAVQWLDGLQDAPRYQIAASFDPETMTLRGTERVRVVNRWNVPLNDVCFRLYPNAGRLYGPAKMDLASVTDDWGAALSWSMAESDTSVVRVELPAEWKPGEALLLNLTWTAMAPTDESRSWTRDDGYGLFREANDVTVLAEWFPMLSMRDDSGWRLDAVPSWGDPASTEIAFYEVWFTAPGRYAVITTGGEVSRNDSGGNSTRRYLSGPTRDFFLAFSPDLWVESTEVGDTVIRSYALTDHAQGGGAALAASAEGMELFNRYFGAYPYRELDVLETPLIGLLGMEYPGVTLLASTIYTRDQAWRLDVTTAHEVAHQWWYGVVGNDILQEPWLDEALATWSSGLYVEQIMGRDAFQAQYEQWVERYESGERSGTVGAVVWPVEQFRSSWDYVTTTYYKGAIALKILRNEIGDNAFFGALRRHYEESRFAESTGQRMLDLFEQESGRDLDAFYREWFFSE